MNWAGIGESIISGVVGALILALFYKVGPTFFRRKPLAWYKLCSGEVPVTSSEGNYEIPYSVVILDNKTRNVLSDVGILCRQEVSHVEVPTGVTFRIEAEGRGSRVVLSDIQCRERIQITLQAKKKLWVEVDSIYVGNERMGEHIPYKIIPNSEVGVPVWTAYFLCFLILLMNVPDIVDVLQNEEKVETLERE